MATRATAGRPCDRHEEPTDLGGSEPIPDPLDALPGLGGAPVPDRSPLVRCLDATIADAYLGLVETLATRLYRERAGGTPTPRRVTDLDELRTETRWLEAESRLTTIALSSADWERLTTDHEDLWRRRWTNRIQNQLFAQEFGVVILTRQVVAPPGDHFPRSSS